MSDHSAGKMTCKFHHFDSPSVHRGVFDGNGNTLWAVDLRLADEAIRTEEAQDKDSSMGYTHRDAYI